MPFEFESLASQVELDPIQFVGIPIALVGAIFLSLGAQFQYRGVNKVEQHDVSGGGALSASQFGQLLARPSWVIGTLLIGLAIAFQLVSLVFSPLIVVQPLGAIALVITAILNSRISKVGLNRPSIIAITLCIVGVGAFVTLAAFTARDRPVTEDDLVIILIILAVVLTAFLATFITLRRKFKALYYIVGAGVLYGFVATLAKVIIGRLTQQQFGLLTLWCVAGLLIAVVVGGIFVQNAYSSGPPDLVIAGLTVIDPVVAVTIGIVVLGEAAQAGLSAGVGYVICGAVAIWGVLLLARYHPQTQVPAGKLTKGA
ncbi:DMT family transporter [Homoserinimonas sp. OAct 916]|uniref:DMT family transporter n=1 Tax=Homoserinimonas sp. OAct 916 TaxID=2211450 RepID=UPI000DBE2064|nr:DMT family transporter [Homoserinimonas sp. OAct 916]